MVWMPARSHRIQTRYFNILLYTYQLLIDCVRAVTRLSRVVFLFLVQRLRAIAAAACRHTASCIILMVSLERPYMVYQCATLDHQWHCS